MDKIELPKNAILDDLTGVYTRGDTMRTIDSFLKGEGKSGTHALIMLDVDNFKQVNDMLGHLSGDKIMRTVAQKIVAFFGEDSFVGRIGGDEFFILMMNTSEELAASRVTKMLNDIQLMLTDSDSSLLVTSSCGIAMYDGASEKPKTLKDLYAEADTALYKSKKDGKNTYSFARRKEDSAFAPRPRHESELLSLQNVLNDIGVSVLVLRGNSPNELVPIYCNVEYLKLSGLTGESFKSIVSKGNLYGVHPDDIAEARKSFAEMYKTGKPMKQYMRAIKPEGNYEWVLALANIKFLDAERFEVYMIFLDAKEHMFERELKQQRFHNLIEKSREDTDNVLSTLELFLTNDRCSIVQRDIDVVHTPCFDGSVNDFINSAVNNVASDIMQQRFKQTFCREALIASFNKGILSINLDVPMRKSNGRVIWCHQKADLTRKPYSEEIECITRLVEDDNDIRIQKSFEHVMKNDYEYVANVNIETEIVTVLSERNSHGLPPTKHGEIFYGDLFRHRLNTLINEEFDDIFVRAIKLERVIAELEKNDSYICTFPANSKLLGHDAVFRWRFCYLDDAKTDIIITRVEMIGFLDKNQKVQINEDNITLAESVSLAPSKEEYILIADDVEINRDLLRLIFEEDYGIIEARDGEEAIRLIDENYEHLALILLDMNMPKKTGLDVIIHINLRGLEKYIPVMIVTGSTMDDVKLQSLEYGVADIVTKPFDSRIVRRRALNLIKLFTHQRQIEHQLEDWKQEAVRMQTLAESNNEMLINTLSSVVEFRSEESGQHIKRVRTLTGIMLKVWGMIDPKQFFSQSDIEEISRAAAMHDIGKVAIPDVILKKPGKLTAEEFEIMKTHTTLGCKILEQFKTEDSSFYNYCYDICRYHHERDDGRGYPDKLVGDQIPIWAQIVSIVDVFDALTSPRVYKAAFSPEKAVEMILNGECGKFSQKLLHCFDLVKDKMAEVCREMRDEQAK